MLFPQARVSTVIISTLDKKQYIFMALTYIDQSWKYSCICSLSGLSTLLCAAYMLVYIIPSPLCYSGDFMARHRYQIKFVFQSVTTAYVVGWSILLASQVIHGLLSCGSSKTISEMDIEAQHDVGGRLVQLSSLVNQVQYIRLWMNCLKAPSPRSVTHPFIY